MLFPNFPSSERTSALALRCPQSRKSECPTCATYLKVLRPGHRSIVFPQQLHSPTLCSCFIFTTSRADADADVAANSVVSVSARESLPHATSDTPRRTLLVLGPQQASASCSFCDRFSCSPPARIARAYWCPFSYPHSLILTTLANNRRQDIYSWMLNFPRLA